MLPLLEGLQGSPQVFLAWATEESLAKALVTVAYILRTHEELHTLLVLGSTGTSDATLNPPNAARRCKAPYAPGARLPAQGWGIMVPEGFRLPARALQPDGAGEHCRVTLRFWRGSLRWVSLWAGTWVRLQEADPQPSMTSLPRAVGFTRLSENAMVMMQFQPLLESASCIL